MVNHRFYGLSAWLCSILEALYIEPYQWRVKSAVARQMLVQYSPDVEKWGEDVAALAVIHEHLPLPAPTAKST
jgi:hypothetical protein